MKRKIALAALCALLVAALTACGADVRPYAPAGSAPGQAIPGGSLGEGAAIAIAMIPFLLAAILFSYYGLQRRAWQQGAKD